MTRRQSARPKGSINYAKFGNEENHSDDDFADNTHPSKKRAKLKDTREVLKNKRLPEKAEKKFEEHIQKALELSISASQQDKENQKASGSTPKRNTIKVNKSGNKVQVCEKKAKNIQEDVQRDKIHQVLVNDAAIKEHQMQNKHSGNDDDDDYQLSDCSSSESDEESPAKSSDEDSDCSFSKPKSKRKAVTQKKQNTPKKSTSKTAMAKKSPVPNATKQQTNGSKKLKVSVPSKPIVKPVRSYQASPISNLPQRKWAPPARAGSTTSRDHPLVVKSPNNIRIGLSRNVRLKPLHPATKT